MFKARAKALKIGSDIDSRLRAEKAKRDAHMAAIQEKFMQQQECII